MSQGQANATDHRLLHDRGIRAPVWAKIPEDVHNGLDLGFGFGEFGLLVRAKNRLNTGVKLTGVDVYAPYCALAKQIGIYNDVVTMDACEYVDKLTWKPDFTICTEMLEHVPKDKGLRLIERIKQKSSRVLFATPLGFMPVIGGIDGNPASEHVSEYKPEDFTARGYHTKIIDTLGIPWYLQPIYGAVQLAKGRGTYKHIIAWAGY